MNKKTLIYLADLTHTGPVISSNTYPLGVGLIASYLLKSFSADIEVELFKYPHDLSIALSKRVPQAIGFSNYSWNSELSYEFASRVKNRYPSVVTIFGGPNYDMEDNNIKEFWQKHTLLDFYIICEGELAMYELFHKLKSHKFDVSAIKNKEVPLNNCHYPVRGKIIKGEILPRVDINEVPSPYLDGLMDKFFAHPLMPFIITATGCPYKCKFCADGYPYSTKIYHRKNIYDEIEYIAKRMQGPYELYIGDTNFGMFKQDIEKARAISDVQKKYNWPQNIGVSSGKENLELQIEVANMLKGAMRVNVSFQSTDEAVLENIGRKNISLDKKNLEIISNYGKKQGSSLTEVILGLPGDSVKTHTKTLEDLVSADFSRIMIYQLGLLPKAEMNSSEMRQKFGLKTKYRNLARSFGKYELFGESFSAVECEEICIETNSLTYEEYLYCRELGLTIEILHNDGMFMELMGLLRWCKFSWFDFIMRFHDIRRLCHPKITSLYDYFLSGAKVLFNSRQEAAGYVKQNLEALLKDEKGTNELASSKSTAFSTLSDEFRDVLFGLISSILNELKLMDKTMQMYIQELKEYTRLRRAGLTEIDKVYTQLFHFDFIAIENQQFAVNPNDYLLNKEQKYTFSFDAGQKKLIMHYIDRYGLSVQGMGRIVMGYANLKKLFRKVSKER